MSIRPITNISNAHGIVIAIQDVTEMSKAHEMVEHSEMQLREAQRIAKIGSWEWEVATNEVTWSEELYRIYGLPYSPKKKTYEEFLQTMSEEGRAKMNTIVQKAFQTKEPYTYVRKMSGDRIIQGNGYVMVDEQGKVERMYGTVQDITNIAKKEEQLQIQNEELHKINSELDRFVYSVSHDLRAPLTSIEGLVDIALDETQEASIQQYLSMIKASTAKLDRFIQDILHYSRNARMDLSIDTVNLHELLNDIVDHHHLPNQKKVQINVSIKAPLPLLTDKTRLMLILNNIISNSVRYSNPKTPQPYVNIEINVSSRHADFVISDNGQGISDSIRPHVFEMFYRGNRDSVGSGLGLYIVKEAVEKLHGTITMQSQVDEGTTFAISIPNYYNTQDF
jgi:signal transduction histidine kinase